MFSQRGGAQTLASLFCRCALEKKAHIVTLNCLVCSLVFAPTVAPIILQFNPYDDLLSAFFATRIESEPHPLRIRYETCADPFTTRCECVGVPSWTPYKRVTNQLRSNFVVHSVYKPVAEFFFFFMVFDAQIHPCHSDICAERLKTSVALLAQVNASSASPSAVHKPAPHTMAQLSPATLALQRTPQGVDAGTLRKAVQEALVGKDLDLISLRELREQVAISLGFQADDLEPRKKEFKNLVQDIVQSMHAEKSPLASLLEEPEKDGLQQVYLITMSHVLGATLPDGRSYKDLETLTRKDVALAVVQAFNAPLPTGSIGGRPRKNPDEPNVLLVVVYKELHKDGDVHFHVAVKLRANMRFKSAKRALQERDCLPSHFSCSHSRLWSSIRYGYIATPAKPDVDEEPWAWTPDWAGPASEAQSVDLFELSQEPFRADSWRKRREQHDKDALKKSAKTTFNKLDLTAVIISKHLYTKDSLLTYAQDYGTKPMQLFVHKNQRKLQVEIEDAKEWDSARDNAAFEAIDDWTLVCDSAKKACPHGVGLCTYSEAAKKIFKENAGTLCQKQLAAAIRDILVNGPKKTFPVPFLVGPSNSGKSTLLYPFDDLFHPRRVLHKPALGSTFGLRNIVGGTKRLIFWDDFRPVEYAQEKTVPVSLFLTLFIGQWSEVQVSQSFNDGNKDVQWIRGALFTGKQEGLWEPTKTITAEEIQHMRNRVREFVFTVVLAKGAMKDVVSCPVCMARWIVAGAAALDAAPGLQPALPTRVGIVSKLDVARVSAIVGLVDLLGALGFPDGAAIALVEDLEELGAISVKEPTRAEWEGLSVWAVLKPLQRRRLLLQLGF